MPESDFERRMRLAVEEMDEGGFKDRTADTQAYPANREITTSPKIVNHNVPFERRKNAHPDLEAVDVEVLLQYVHHDKSLEEIITEGYPAYDKDRLKEVLEMDYIEAAKLAMSDDPLLYSDEDYEDEVEEDQDG